MQALKNALRRLQPRKPESRMDRTLHLEKAVFSGLVGEYFWMRQQGEYAKLEKLRDDLQSYTEEGLAEAELALQVIDDFREYEAKVKGWKGGMV